MKALTVRQPWASAIAEGAKTVENRSMRTKYRGPLAIHAAKYWSASGVRSPLIHDQFGRDIMITEVEKRDGTLRTWPKVDVFPPRFPVSAIIAVADLVDVHHCEEGCCPPWGENTYIDVNRRTVTPWHWVFENARQVVPIETTGRLGLWPVPDDIITEIDLDLLEGTRT